MGESPRVGWFGRTFGWNGSRSQWAVLLGVTLWLVGVGVIWWLSNRWSPSTVNWVSAGWFFAGLVAARQLVVDAFGPVFMYDLLRISRNRTTFLVRMVYIFCIGLTLVTMYVSFLDYELDYFDKANKPVTTGLMAKFGSDFFLTFILMQFAVMVLLTPVYMAGTICVEKERKTIEFLFATDLRNQEIIFGKLAARFLTLLSYVFVGLPVLALLQLFGGVDPMQLLASFLVTLTMILGLSALSVWFSTHLKKARDAIVLTTMSWVVYEILGYFAAFMTLAPFFGGAWWNQTMFTVAGLNVAPSHFLTTFTEGSLLHQLIYVAISGRGNLTGVDLSDPLRHFIVFWLFASALLVGHAILRLRTVALAQAYGPARGTKSRKRKVIDKPPADVAGRPVDAGSPGTKTVTVNELVRKHPPVGDNPVLWKEVFVDTGGGGCAWKIMGALMVLIALGSLGIIVYESFFSNVFFPGNLSSEERWYRFRDDANGWVRVVTGIVTFFMLLSAAIRGSGAISGERDKDTWISLQSVPMSSKEILWGKFWGCMCSVRRPMFLMFLVWSLGLCVGAVELHRLLMTLGVLLMFLAAFSFIGLLCSMTARNTMVASVRAFLFALFAMGGFWLVIGLVASVLRIFFPNDWFDPLGQVFLGGTPPFITGWLPQDFEGYRPDDYGPFSSRDGRLGIAAIPYGLAPWVGITLFLGFTALRRFRRLTNELGAPLPKTTSRNNQQPSRGVKSSA